MKIPTSEAAKRLGTHPANIVLHLSEMVGDLTDSWPELEEGLVETLRALKFKQEIQPPTPIPGPPVRERTVEEAPRSRTQMKVLDKLERHDKWGGTSVSLRTLRNNYCQGLGDLDEAVHALVDDGLLLGGDGRNGPFSLNPARKGEIERIVAGARRRQ